MPRYDAEIDTANPNLSHTQVVELVGRDKAVLDVGCASGYLARALQSQGCRVSGIEIDPVAAETARDALEKLVVGDLNHVRLSDSFDAASFDVLVFADVLEHVLEPATVLADALTLLAPGGRVVISIPNVAHGAVRLALLQGRWEYTDTGLLDSTHVRFFTYASLMAMLDEAGLVVEDARSTVADPLTAEVSINADGLPPSVVEWVRHQQHALDYQFVLSARRAEADEVVANQPRLTPALPASVVRAEDHHTQRAREEQEATHRAMTVRDHVVGLEATAARAERDVEALQGQVEHLHRELAAAAEDRERIRRSTTWKAGRIATVPLRLARRIGRFLR